MYKSCIYYQISVWSLFTDFPEWKIRPTCLYIPRPLISDWSYLCQLSFLCYCGRFKLHNTPMCNSLVMLCLRSFRIHGTISIKSWWSVKSLHLHSKAWNGNNSKKFCYDLQSSLTWKICGVFCFYSLSYCLCRRHSPVNERKRHHDFFWDPVCASIHRQHHPTCSWLQCPSLGPSPCLASLLSMAVTSWHQEKNGLMIYSNPIAFFFFLWLQGTPGRASYLALHS